jgi:hypothetical protein
MENWLLISIISLICIVVPVILILVLLIAPWRKRKGKSTGRAVQSGAKSQPKSTQSQPAKQELSEEEVWKRYNEAMKKDDDSLFL